MNSALWYGVLGPVTVSMDGDLVKLGGPKERLILAALLMAKGRVVSVDRLVDVLWGENPPDRAVATLQVHISNLRRRLGDGRPTIITQPPGYVLLTTAASFDLLRFEEIGGLAQDHLEHGTPDQALGLLEEAEGLWRGDPLSDISDGELHRNTVALLEQRRLAGGELRARALLACGRHQDALDVIEMQLVTEPLRETLWGQRMLALYRAGRQAEALDAYQDCRARLLNELGVDPTPALQELERLILRHDPALELETHFARSATSPQAEMPATFVAAKHAAQLVLASGMSVPVVDVTTIGRHPGSDVVLEDASVSRNHAEIRAALGGHLLSDLSSSNGTSVAGEPVLHRLLEDGDQIEIGPHRLTYRRC